MRATPMTAIQYNALHPFFFGDKIGPLTRAVSTHPTFEFLQKLKLL
jgi:hypothetical protein